jgi:hypothetical protein
VAKANAYVLDVRNTRFSGVGLSTGNHGDDSLLDS